VTFTVVAAVLAALVGVGLYGLAHQPVRHAVASLAGADVPTQLPSTEPAPLNELIHTDDPVTYAAAVANALFTWNTRSGLLPEDYQSVISEDADPSGVETSGLVNDLAAYYPTDPQWQQLRHYATAQTLTIVHAYVPSAWGHAMASDPSAAKPGTVAVTVDAIRHRTGTWYGTKAATSDPVSFTVFVACQPTYPRCQVLRLSAVNTPLK
jgi:hypothetical protein